MIRTLLASLLVALVLLEWQLAQPLTLFEDGSVAFGPVTFCIPGNICEG